MYRCSICPTVSQPGQPRLCHAVLRRDGSIERELPVCAECWRRLTSGAPLSLLQAEQQPKPEAAALAAAAPQTPAKPAAASVGDEL